MPQFIDNLTQTWNETGVTKHGIKLNVTDTDSAADSLLLDLQVGGTSKFTVGKDGKCVSSSALSIKPAAREYRIEAFDGGGNFVFTRSDVSQYLSVGFFTGYTFLSTDATGDLVMAGRKNVVIEPGETSKVVQIGRRRSDSNVAIGCSTEFWTYTGQTAPAIAIKAPGGASSVFHINASGQVEPVNASSVGLTIKGLAVQTGNLTEWQDSSSAVKSYMMPTGQLGWSYALSSPDLNGIRWFSPGSWEVRMRNETSSGDIVIDYNTVEKHRFAASGILQSITLQATTGKLILGKTTNTTSTITELLMFGTANAQAWLVKSYNAIGVQVDRLSVYGKQDPTRIIFHGNSNQGTTNITEWQNSGGTVLSSIRAGGSLTVNGALSNDDAWTTGTPGVRIGFNSFPRIMLENTGNKLWEIGVQSPDDFTIRQLSTVRMAYNDTNGYWYWDADANLGNSGTPGARVQITNVSAARVGLVVKASVAQSANLQEWQDSSGTLLGSFGVNQFRGPNGSVIAGQSPGIAFRDYANTGIGAGSGNIAIWESGVIALNLTNVLKEFRVPSDYYYSWSAVTNNNAASDTKFSRASAGVIKFGVGSAYNALMLGCPTAGTVGLDLYGAASQSANLQRWLNNTGTVLSRVLPGGGLHIKSQDLYRSILLENNGVGVQAAAITFQDGANKYTIGMSGSNFVITADEFVSGSRLIQFGTAAHGRSVHASDSNNVYGAGSINAEVAPSAAYPAFHALMRGTPAGTEEAIRVTSGPAYTTKVFAVDYDGKIKTNQTSAGTTLGSVTDKMAVYDAAGTLVGYVPIYDTIT